MKKEILKELNEHIIPFWLDLKDEEHGGYYGYKDSSLVLNKKGEKGCIHESRILWFFSEAYRLLGDEEYLAAADHAYDFMKKNLFDPENGGVFWSVTYDGKVLDDTKHVYSHSFAIYGLSAYSRASGKPEPLDEALQLFALIEGKMRDPEGYGEAFGPDFGLRSNEKLSENGVEASRTMNTLLHVIEAYTLLYAVSNEPKVKEALLGAVNILIDKVYRPEKKRLGVFFDKDYNDLIDLYSYGHDIEAAWLTDRAAETLGICPQDPAIVKRGTTEGADKETGTEEKNGGSLAELSFKIRSMTDTLEDAVLHEAFRNDSLPLECENGVVAEQRVWWVQAEAVNGFLNAWQKHPEREDYLKAAERIWGFIRDYVVDSREGGEWYSEVGPDGKPDMSLPEVEPWKCPYHNGRMCFEVMERNVL
ncbi:MAG: AGE family epimerase/isomerase [Blautia sp.]|nr:AGE family epimerase/isomerase [Blautia sp.]